MTTERYWNHRVIRSEYKYPSGEIEYSYAIHEVYYNKKDKPESWTSRPVTIIGEDIKGIKWELKMMKKCLKKPVLYVVEKNGKEKLKPIE